MFWRRRNSQSFLSILEGLGIIALFLLAMLLYTKHLQEELWQGKTKEVEEVSKQVVHSLNLYLEKDRLVLDNVAHELSKLPSTELGSIQTDLEKVTSLHDTYILINMETNRVFLTNLDWARENGKDVLRLLGYPENFLTHGLREPYISFINGRKSIGYYTKFEFSDGVPALIIKEATVKELASKFNLEMYNDKALSFIVNREGDVLFPINSEGSHISFLNLFQAMEKGGGNNHPFLLLKNSIAKGEPGVLTFEYHDSEFVMVYQDVHNTDNWYLVTLVPSAELDTAARSISKGAFLIGFGSLFAVLLLLIILRQSQRAEKMASKIEEDNIYRAQIYNALGRYTNDIFMLVGEDAQTVEYITPNIYRHLGLSPEDKITNVFQLKDSLKSSSRDFVWGDLFGASTGTVLTRDCVRENVVTKEEKFFQETVVKINAEDKQKYLVVFSDRTPEHLGKKKIQDALEIAEAANKAKSRFLSNMSHDIRTPLNTIGLLVNMLKKDYADPRKVKETTDVIEVSTKLLQGIINDILDMSKIESGKTSLSIREFSLSGLMNSLSEIVRTLTAAKKQTFEVSVGTISSDSLLGDEKKLDQILMNFLSNAVKYTPAGGKIEFSATQLPSDYAQHKARFLFEIKDNGIGIPEDFKKVIFDPFTQVNDVMSANIQGTGLGMAIAKKLVDLMGGTIELESRLGHGSVFRITLDFPEKKTRDEKEFWKMEGISRMLVVDDEPYILETIREMMAGTPVKITEAQSGAEALELLKNHPDPKKAFDLILIDWALGCMNGGQTAAQIRHLGLSSVPIVLLSSFDWSEIGDKIEAGAVDGFISKPFFPKNLRIELDEIKKRRAEANKAAHALEVFKGLRVLIAEDNELNASILATLLEEEGAHIQVAENGAIAVRMFEDQPLGSFDLILMDIQMPEMNGYEATRAIRKSGRPDAESVVIVALTANAFADDVKQAMDAGMDFHQAKPLDIEKFAVWLAKYLGERSS